MRRDDDGVNLHNRPKRKKKIRIYDRFDFLKYPRCLLHLLPSVEITMDGLEETIETQHQKGTSHDLQTPNSNGTIHDLQTPNTNGMSHDLLTPNTNSTSHDLQTAPNTNVISEDDTNLDDLSHYSSDITD